MWYIIVMDNVKENIAKNIARLRTENNMTQPELAKKLNYTHDHYVAISKQTFKEQTMDIEKIAKENLTQIGAMFKNE